MIGYCTSLHSVSGHLFPHVSFRKCLIQSTGLKFMPSSWAVPSPIVFLLKIWDRYLVHHQGVTCAEKLQMKEPKRQTPNMTMVDIHKAVQKYPCHKPSSALVLHGFAWPLHFHGPKCHVWSSSCKRMSSNRSWRGPSTMFAQFSRRNHTEESPGIGDARGIWTFTSDRTPIGVLGSDKKHPCFSISNVQPGIHGGGDNFQ